MVSNSKSTPRGPGVLVEREVVALLRRSEEEFSWLGGASAAERVSFWTAVAVVGLVTV